MFFQVSSAPPIFVTDVTNAHNEPNLIKMKISAVINAAWEIPIPMFETVFSRKKGLFLDTCKDLPNVGDMIADAIYSTYEITFTHRPNGVLIYCDKGVPRGMVIAAGVLKLHGNDAPTDVIFHDLSQRYFYEKSEKEITAITKPFRKLLIDWESMNNELKEIEKGEES